MKIDWKQGALAALVMSTVLTAACSSAQSKWARQMAAGERYTEKRDYARAILSYRNAAGILPRSGEAYYRLALAYMATGDAANAAAQLRKTLEVEPAHAGARVRLSEMMLWSSERPVIEQAHTQLETLLRTKPDNVEALAALAIAEWKLARPEEAEAHLREAFDRAPGALTSAVALAKIYVRRGDFDGAEQVLRKSAAQTPPSADALVALGEYLLFRKRAEEAGRQFDEALRLDSRHAIALSHVAALQVSRREMEAAERTYRTISKLADKRYRPVHAIFLLQTGRRDEGIRELRALVEDDAKDRTTRSALVAALLGSGQTAEAEKALDQALSKNPRDADALIQRGAILLSRGRTDEALRDLNQTLEFRSDAPEVHYLLSKVHEQRESPLSQRQELNEAVRLRPEFLEARLELAMLLVRGGAARTAMQVLSQAPESQRQTAAFLTQRNWVLMALGQVDEARQSVDAMLGKTRSADLLVQDAALKVFHRQPAEARRSAREVLDRNPADVRALELLAATYPGDEDSREVESYVARVPQSAAAQQFLGAMLVRKNRIGEARQAFEAARKADPGQALADLSLARLDVNEGKWTEALARLEEVLKQRGENLTARYWLGHIEQKLGHREAAIAHYRKLLETDADHAATLNNLAFLLAGASGGVDEALKFAEKAKELAPDNPAVENTLGWVLYRKGMYSMAVKHLEKAVQAEATPRRKCHLGMAFLQTGDRRRGQQLVESALATDPSLAEAGDARKLLARLD